MNDSGLVEWVVDAVVCTAYAVTLVAPLMAGLLLAMFR